MSPKTYSITVAYVHFKQSDNFYKHQCPVRNPYISIILANILIKPNYDRRQMNNAGRVYVV